MKNLDAKFCGTLPLHNINLIQPHGALLVLDTSEGLRIVQVSENVAPVVGLPPEALLDQPLANFLSGEAVAEAASAAARAGTDAMPLRLRFMTPTGPRGLIGLFRPSIGCTLLELESGADRESPSQAVFGGFYSEMKTMMAAVTPATTAEEACAAAVVELKRFSGFDQVMAYRFDAAWNGTVVGEVREESMPSYLGLRFPPSDIPKQARALYSRNPYRLIASRDAAPAKLTPVLSPLTGSFTDLSDCTLCASPAVHIEYLTNMGVVASMSTRILVNGQLWGLVSCHHRAPKYPGYEACSAFELLVGVLAGKLTALKAEEEAAGRASLQSAEASILERLYALKSLRSALTKESAAPLKRVLGVDGVAIVEGKQISTDGTTPSDEAIREMVLWLQASGLTASTHWQRLSDAYEPASKFADSASGMICLPLRPAQGDYILGFKREVLQTVSWGGNPADAITFEADGKKYHPRASFQIWKEQLSGTSLPWEGYELEAAERLRNYVQEFLLREVYA